jgi:inhibitor of KinA
MIQFQPLGDQGIQIVFSDQVNEGVSRQIRSFMQLLDTQDHLPVLEPVPAYTTLSIYYDVMKMDYDDMVENLRKLSTKISDKPQEEQYIIEIPTCYGGIYGPDLAEVATHNQVTPEEVISIHTAEPYLIYMLGFSPGFPYLGGMSDVISCPRLATPRAKVPRGSVGIAGGQTGIYPIESPGGWRIIGRTPLPLYQPKSKSPILLQAGDYVRFVPIEPKDYDDLIKRIEQGQDVKANTYLFHSEERGELK